MITINQKSPKLIKLHFRDKMLLLGYKVQYIFVKFAIVYYYWALEFTTFKLNIINHYSNCNVM